MLNIMPKIKKTELIMCDAFFVSLKIFKTLSASSKKEKIALKTEV